LESVAQTAIEIRDALAPLRKELGKATGSKKGAITKHLNRVLDGLLQGVELNEEDAALVTGVDMKNLEKTRELGNGLVRRIVDGAVDTQSPDEIGEIGDDLCLRTDGKIQKEDLDAVVAWLLKAREMYQDIEQRREDAREAAVEARNRLEQTWLLFKDLEPKMV